MWLPPTRRSCYSGSVIDERADGVWTIDHPFQLSGAQFGTRTTLIRLSTGPATAGLWMHSPGPLPGDLAHEIARLGPVEAIVAPNKVHYLFVEENAVAFPNAELHLAPGLAEKRPKLPPGETLGDEPSPRWAGDVDQVWVRGSSFLEEIVFFHAATRTLVLTDLAFNFSYVDHWWTRQMLRITGAHGRFTPSRLARATMRDKPAIRRGIDRILEWDFDRVIVAHGAVVESGGKETLRAAYGWLPSG